MKTKLFLISLLIGFTFSSCEKCKDCVITYETLNGYNTADLNDAAVLLGYANWDAYLASLYPSEELCDDALDAAEEVSESTDLDGDGIEDYRAYWDCK